MTKTRGGKVFTLWAGSVLVVALSGVAGLAVGSASPHAHRARGSANARFWARLRIQGSETERYDDFATMARESDLVVVGRLSNFRLSRQIQGDAVEDVVTLAASDVLIDRVLHGDAPAPTVPIEFLLGTGADDAPGLIAGQQKQMPHESMIMFLRAKGGSEQGFYRLVNSHGLWIDSEQGVIAPLGEGSISDIYAGPELTTAEVAQGSIRDRAAAERARLDGKTSERDPVLAEFLATSHSGTSEEPSTPTDPLAEESRAFQSLHDLETLVHQVD